MGCTTGKTSSHKHNKNHNNDNNSSELGQQQQKRSRSLDSPELAYQFIMMMKQQQELELSNPELMNAKRIDEKKHQTCPRLSRPTQSSLISKRQKRLSKIQTACTIHFQDQEK